MRGKRIAFLALLLAILPSLAQAWEEVKKTEKGVWMAKPYKEVENYQCPYEVAIFLPTHPSTIRILYLHGYQESIPQALKSAEYNLDQVEGVVILPQGPCKQKKWNWSQKILDNFPSLIAETEEEIKRHYESQLPNERYILAAHSAGCSPALQVLKLSHKFTGVVLLDAFYAGLEPFLDWQRTAEGRKLWAICTSRSAATCDMLKKKNNPGIRPITVRHTTHNGTVGYLARLFMEGTSQLAKAN
jgi:hypothetical protein